MDKNRSRRRNRYLAPGVAVAMIAVLGASLVYFRGNSPYGLPGGFVGTPEILLRLNDVELVGRSGGKRIWSLKARHVDVSQARIRTDFESITHGNLYNGEKLAATITAGRGSYDSISGDVHVSGGVRVSSPQGYRAEADSANWSAYFRRLVCPGKVTMSTKNSRAEGQNLVADARTGTVAMDNPQMTISVSDVPDVGSITSVPGLGGRQ